MAFILELELKRFLEVILPMFEFIVPVLKPEMMEDYVKKNRKDDLRKGILFVIGAVVVALVLGFIFLAVYNLFAGIIPSLEQIGVVEFSKDIVAVALMNFIGYMVGLTATFYVASLFGKKTKFGEYFYFAGIRLVHSTG